jgi:asparagine synthase (glutamine-hydrolysing)
MCGIWLWIKHFKGDSMNCIESENNIKERGPDETNIIENEHMRIVFYRLAIHDISNNGSQPFYLKKKNKEYYLICNGEIYNYKEIKSKYKIKCQSNSDCEILLHLYLHFNENIDKMIQIINGEFAFVLIQIHNDIVSGYIVRDPYGVRPLFTGNTVRGLFISSLLKGINDISENVNQFSPREIAMFYKDKIVKKYTYYQPKIYEITIEPIQWIYYEVTKRLICAVQKRMDSERPMGALLSGGLDSSLIIGIVYKILKQKIKVFSIGFENSTDIMYAKQMVDFLNIQDYSFVKLSYEEALESIEKVIWSIESYDITSIRASIMHYKLAEYIRTHTDIKVILNGDGADELQMGYLYFKLSPDKENAEKESQKLLEEIHFFDGLRVDRCLGAFGLEARLPYLDIEFVDFFRSIPTELKVPFQNQEKNLIRQAFYHCYPHIIPYEILFRQKEAFSDGVSTTKHSWHSILKEYIKTKNLNIKDSVKYNYNTPFSTESLYYRKIFDKLFNKNNKNFDTIIPHYWQPNFTKETDPSARELSIYIGNK